MNPAEQTRFDLLRGDGSVTPDYLRDYYGLNWPWSGDAQQDFEAWLARSSRRSPWSDDRPSRLAVEEFLRDQRLQSKKWAACELGMDEESFDRVFHELPRIGLRPRRYEVYPGLISTSFGKDLDAHLPRMRFRTFSDNDTYCEFLHGELRNELGVDVKPEFCATSTTRGDYPRRFARTFDNITLEPLSVRHQMFLDFGKPLYLKSDVCSKLFYAQNRESLKEFHGGSREPHDIHEYEVEHHA